MSNRFPHPKIQRIVCPFPGEGIVFVYYIDAPRPALIDTGVALTPHSVIAPSLTAAGKSIADVKYIINTHGHWDHAGGAGEAKDAVVQGGGNADILIHAADTGFLGHPRNRALNPFTAALKLLNRPEELAGVEAVILEAVGREVAADRVLNGGESIDLGGDVRLTAVHTPGHTAGSISLYWESEQVLLSGDAIQGAGTATRFPLYDDAAAYAASMAKLADMDIELLCMAHGFASTGSDKSGQRYGKEAVHQTLRESREAHDQIDALVRAALAADPAASIADVARSVSAALHTAWGIDVPEDGINLGSVMTVRGHYLPLTGQS